MLRFLVSLHDHALSLINFASFRLQEHHGAVEALCIDDLDCPDVVADLLSRVSLAVVDVLKGPVVAISKDAHRVKCVLWSRTHYAEYNVGL